MIARAVIVLFGLTVIAGLWLAWSLWCDRGNPLYVHLIHGGCGFVGLFVFLGWISFVSSWRVNFYYDVSIGALISAGLIGIILGLIRVADQQVPSNVVGIHIILALVGLSGFVMAFFI